jgi:hypothetical protein
MRSFLYKYATKVHSFDSYQNYPVLTYTFRNPKNHILSFPFPKELSIHPNSISVTSNLLVFIAELQPQSVRICPVAEFPAVPPPLPPPQHNFISVLVSNCSAEQQSERNS